MWRQGKERYKWICKENTARPVAQSLHNTLNVISNTKKKAEGRGWIMNRRKYNIQYSHLHVKETLTLIVRGVQLLKQDLLKEIEQYPLIPHIYSADLNYTVLKPLTPFFLLFIIILCVHATCMYRSVDNLQESALSYCYAGPRTWTQGIRPGSKHLYQLSNFTSPNDSILLNKQHRLVTIISTTPLLNKNVSKGAGEWLSRGRGSL